MEGSALLVFIGGFVLCAALVFVVSFFGVQGETFEEALEAQRKKQTSEKRKDKKKDAPVEKKKKVKKAKDNNGKTGQVQEDDEGIESIATTEKSESSEESFVAKTIEKPKKEVKKKETKKPEKMEAQPIVEEIVPVQKATIQASAAPAPAPSKPVAKNSPGKAPAKENASNKGKAVEKEPVAVSQTKVEIVEKVATVGGSKVQDLGAKAQDQVQQHANDNKKKKIEIIDVDKSEDSGEEKKKKSGKEKKGKSDLLTMVRQAVLTDTETQAIINTLLLKQSGKEETTDDWIEPGKESEAKKASRQLNELKQALEDEVGKSAGLEKKLATLRKELVEEKSVRKGALEEINQKRTQEVGALNTKIQQLSSQLSNANTLNQQLEASQANYKGTINQLQSKVNSGAADPHILTELEHLRATRSEMNQNEANLKQMYTAIKEEAELLAKKNKEVESKLEHLGSRNKQLEVSVGAKEAELDEVRDELAKKSSQAAQLVRANIQKQEDAVQQESSSNQQLAGIKSHLESQLAAVTTAKNQLQLELSVLKEKLSVKETESARLLEENERLCEQVVSCVERTAGEGQESSKVNGHSEAEELKNSQKQTASCDDSKVWEEKLQALSIDNEKILARQKDLESQVEEKGQEIAKLRSKNDEKSKELAAAKNASISLLERLFPSIHGSTQDLKQFEVKAKSFLQNLESASSAEVVDQSDVIAKLDGQINHYKTVLAQTEAMLTALQASVEKAESDWKKKLDSAFSEHESFKSQISSLKIRNTKLEEELADLRQKLESLESLEKELDVERCSKNDLAKKCTELQMLVSAAQQQMATQAKEELKMNGTLDEGSLKA